MIKHLGFFWWSLIGMSPTDLVVSRVNLLCSALFTASVDLKTVFSSVMDIIGYSTHVAHLCVFYVVLPFLYCHFALHDCMRFCCFADDKTHTTQTLPITNRLG